MFYKFTRNALKFSFLLTVCSTITPTVQALPPRPIFKIQGNVFLSNCNANLTDVSIRRVPGTAVPVTNRVVLADGRVKMSYSFVVPAPEGVPEEEYTLTPTLRPGVCAGGSWSPSTKTHVQAGANASFTYTGPAGTTHRISALEINTRLQPLVAAARIHLNNLNQQNSQISVNGIAFGFNIAPAHVDLDACGPCPDLGDAIFYVGDTNLNSASIAWQSPAFRINTVLEDSGREVKGFHSSLGDDFVPDFDLRNISLSILATPKVANSGDITLSFSNAHLNATIDSTGGCNLGGVDLCDKFFGSDRKIQSAVESATLSAFNGGTIQSVLQAALKSFLQSKGVNQPVLSMHIEGNDLVIVTR